LNELDDIFDGTDDVIPKLNAILDEIGRRDGPIVWRDFQKCPDEQGVYWCHGDAFTSEYQGRDDGKEFIVTSPVQVSRWAIEYLWDDDLPSVKDYISWCMQDAKDSIDRLLKESGETLIDAEEVERRRLAAI